MKVVCQGCQAEIELPDPSYPRVINLPAVSMIVLEHPHVYTCPECGLRVAHGITGGDPLSLIAIPLPKDQQPPKVSPILGVDGMHLKN